MNVLALRYEPGAPLFRPVMKGRSHCRVCKAELRWFELIPIISFVVQGARCRKCQAPLLWQYPAAELVTGFVTAFVPLRLFSYFQGARFLADGMLPAPFLLFIGFWLLAAYALIVTALIDLRLMVLPDQINVFIGVAGLGAVIVKALYPAMFLYNNGTLLGSYGTLFGFSGDAFLSAFMGAIVGVLFFAFIIATTRGRGMGMGDVKLAAPLGILLGWPDIILSIMASFIIGAVWSIGLLIAGAKKMKDGVPFGPFLVLGVFLVLFYGERMVKWYFTLVQ